MGQTLWLLALSPEPILAYLDPGSGSLFLQILLGGVAGAFVFVKLFWKRLTSIFGGHQAEADWKPPQGEASTGTEEDSPAG